MTEAEWNERNKEAAHEAEVRKAEAREAAADSFPAAREAQAREGKRTVPKTGRQGQGTSVVEVGRAARRVCSLSRVVQFALGFELLGDLHEDVKLGEITLEHCKGRQEFGSNGGPVRSWRNQTAWTFYWFDGPNAYSCSE